jgi:hypothetical protein
MGIKHPSSVINNFPPRQGDSRTLTQAPVTIDPVPHRSGPKPPSYPVSDAWRLEIEAAMRARGWTKTDLANAVGSSRPAISIVLNPKTKNSRLVPDIHRALGLPPPRDPAPRSELQHRWETVFDRLGEDHIKKILDLAEAVATPVPPPGPPKRRT